jgi:hypothetical protein
MRCDPSSHNAKRQSEGQWFAVWKVIPVKPVYEVETTNRLVPEAFSRDSPPGKLALNLALVQNA